MIGLEHPQHIGQVKSESFSNSVYIGAFSYWKFGILCFLTAGFGFVSSYLINNSFLIGGSNKIQMLAWGSASLVLFLILSALDIIFVNRNWAVSVLMGIGGLSLGVGILNFSQNSLLVIAAAIIVMISAGLSAKNLSENSLKIQFFKTSNTVLKGVILAAAIIAGFVFFNKFSSEPLGGNNPILPQSFFESAVNEISKFISPSLGGLDFSLSLNQIASQAVDAQIASNSNAAFISQAQKDLMISSIVDQYKQRLSSIFGSTVNPDEKLSSSLYSALINKINNLPDSTRNWVLIGGAILMLLTVTAVSPIIRPIIILFAFVFYEILLAINFGMVISETKSKETVVMP